MNSRGTSLEGALEDQFGLPRSSKPRSQATVGASLTDGPLIVKGKVVDSEGRPVAGAEVTYDVVGAKKVRTGPAGDFSFTLDRVTEIHHHHRRRGRAWRQDALHFTFTADGEKPRDRSDGSVDRAERRISEPLKLSPGTTVIGRVVRDVQPVPGVTVGLEYRCLRDRRSRPKPGVQDGRARGFPVSSCPARNGLSGFPSSSESLKNQRRSHPATRAYAQKTGRHSTCGDLQVQSGRRLAGQMICADGQVRARGHVCCRHGPQWDVVYSIAEIDDKGRFELNGIPDGPGPLWAFKVTTPRRPTFISRQEQVPQPEHSQNSSKDRSTMTSLI